jgi:hypothetical protein
LVRPCTPAGFEIVYVIVNSAAIAYRGVIPLDRWKEPYMPRNELAEEIEDSVRF